MALDAVTVVCELDGARYSVPAAKARRSNLIQSLSSEINSLVEGISVPFSAGDVGPWLAFDVSDPCNTILTCVSTLKVSDFLADRTTVLEAARHANVLLQRLPEARTREAQSSQAVEKSSALLSLQPHLVTDIISEGGDPSSWFMKLPDSLHAFVLPAAVRDNTLLIEQCPAALAPHMSQALYSIPSSLECLTLGCDSEVFMLGATLLHSLAHLSQLHSLQLINVQPLRIPSTLTALTQLSIVKSNHMPNSCCVKGRRAGKGSGKGPFSSAWSRACSQPAYKLTKPIKAEQELDFDLTALFALKELVIENVFPSSSEGYWTGHPGVTALQLHVSHAISESDVSILTDFLAAFSSLSTFRFHGPSIIGTQDTGANPMHGRMERRIHNASLLLLRVLPSLEQLTSLQLAGCFESSSSVFEAGLEALWPHLRKVAHLQLKLHSPLSPLHLGYLIFLQHFHLEVPNATSSVVDSFIEALPRSLTALVLIGRVELQHSHTLQLPFTQTNLRSLTLAGFDLDPESLQHVSTLTSLTRFSTRAEPPSDVQYVRPSEQLTALLQAVPIGIRDLDVGDVEELSVSAAPMLASLTSLEHLRLGRVCSGAAAMALAETITELSELRTLRALWGAKTAGEAPEGAMHAWEEMLSSLQSLPNLCSEDARPAGLLALHALSHQGV